MIYKGRKPMNEKPQSNMRRVLRLIEQGYTDRGEMAKLLNLTRGQVTNAVENLKSDGLLEVHQHRYIKPGHGRLDTIYRVRGFYMTDEERRPMAGVSFIFWACGKESKL